MPALSRAPKPAPLPAPNDPNGDDGGGEVPKVPNGEVLEPDIAPKPEDAKVDEAAAELPNTEGDLLARVPKGEMADVFANPLVGGFCA